jgi:hypothetical protein
MGKVKKVKKIYINHDKCMCIEYSYPSDFMTI